LWAIDANNSLRRWNGTSWDSCGGQCIELFAKSKETAYVTGSDNQIWRYYYYEFTCLTSVGNITGLAGTTNGNSPPSISSVYVNEPGNPFVGDEIIVVCEASDADGDEIYYKFFIYRESVGAAREELTGWQTENSVKIKLDRMDYGGISVYAQVRDKYHADEGSYDAEGSVFIDVQRASISSVSFSLASPRAHETTIEVVCTANKSSGLYYRFWLYGPGTGNVWKDMTGWIEKNSWSWRTLACDIGNNWIRVEVTDTKADWSDSDTSDRRSENYYGIT